MESVEIEDRVIASYFIPRISDPKRDSRFFIDGINPWGNPACIELNYKDVCGLIDVLQEFIEEVREYGKKN